MPPADLVIDTTIAIAAIATIATPAVWLIDRALEHVQPTTPREVRTPGSTSRPRRAAGPVDAVALGWLPAGPDLQLPSAVGLPAGGAHHDQSTHWRPAREALAANHPGTRSAQ